MKDTYRLRERTLLDDSGKAVPSGHPDGIRVLGNVGKEIPLEVAVEVGLVSEKKPKSASSSSTKKKTTTTRKQLAKSAPSDKAIRLDTDGKETK